MEWLPILVCVVSSHGFAWGLTWVSVDIPTCSRIFALIRKSHTSTVRIPKRIDWLIVFLSHLSKGFYGSTEGGLQKNGKQQ